MKRIIAHWTGGTYKANAIDRRHYHLIINGDGSIVKGNNPVSANAAIKKGSPYAAHTRGINTGSIGISVACMAKATERDFGNYKMTKEQWLSMCKEIAKLSKRYNIQITRKNVLSHAEVQRELGIKQNNKWDFTCLPWFSNKILGARVVGDLMRKQVREYIRTPNSAIVYKPSAPKEVKRPSSTLKKGSKGKLVTKLQEDLILLGFDLKIDGDFGKNTELVLSAFQEKHGLKPDGVYGSKTKAAIKAALGEKLKPLPLVKESLTAKAKKPTAGKSRTVQKPTGKKSLQVQKKNFIIIIIEFIVRLMKGK